MSERRHPHHTRRQRRKATTRSRSNARGIGRVDRELSDLLARMAAAVVGDVHEVTDALDAEQWASALIGTWDALPASGEDMPPVFFTGFIDALEQLGSPRALATLRAVAAVGPGARGTRASGAADRLAARGIAEAPWAAALGQAMPTAAALVVDEAFDDGVSVLVEFRGDGYEPHTLGVYIDHNLGGLVKDVFVAGPLDEIRNIFSRSAVVTIRDLALAEARARIDAARYILDHTFDPPVSEDVQPARAMLDARARLLPDGVELASEHREMTSGERDALLTDFLGSPEGRRWRDDEDAEDVVRLAIDFGADYNHGGPLRWSPVVVETFMSSWLARKVGREPAFFTHVPPVLADWVQYAGVRRGVPATPLREAVAAVEDYREEMLEAASDPAAWDPTKVFATAALDAGVDLADREQVERFIARYNAGLVA
jgi:hypothetical protein